MADGIARQNDAGYGPRSASAAGAVMEKALAELWMLVEPVPVGRESGFSWQIMAALEYIRSQYAEAIRVKDIADRAKLSKFHFIRRFKEETGYTPHAYLALLRVKHAKRLLVSRPDLRVREVGALVGYRDPTAFTRLFKRQAGEPPQRYRQEQLRGLFRSEE